MDVGRTLSYIFEDERWVTKVLIGGLVLLIPFIGSLVLIGYMLKTAQNVARGVERPLPEWSEFGDLLMRGLYGFIISLVYMLPYIVVYGICACAMGGFTAAAETSDDPSALIGGLACIIMPIVLLLAFLGGLMSYAGWARYIATDQLSEAFKFGEVFAMLRNNLGLFLMAMLVVGILSGIVAMLGIIAIFIGVLFTGFMAYLMQGHALGQLTAKLFPMNTGGYVSPGNDYSPPTIQL